jgi:hypothetical protein
MVRKEDYSRTQEAIPCLAPDLSPQFWGLTEDALAGCAHGCWDSPCLGARRAFKFVIIGKDVNNDIHITTILLFSCGYIFQNLSWISPGKESGFHKQYPKNTQEKVSSRWKRAQNWGSLQQPRNSTASQSYSLAFCITAPALSNAQPGRSQRPPASFLGPAPTCAWSLSITEPLIPASLLRGQMLHPPSAGHSPSLPGLLGFLPHPASPSDHLSTFYMMLFLKLFICCFFFFFTDDPKPRYLSSRPGSHFDLCGSQAFQPQCREGHYSSRSCPD